MRKAWFLSVLAVVTTACPPKDDENVSEAALASDSSAVVSAESELLIGAIDGSESAGTDATGEQVAVAAKALVTARYTPSGCVTSEQTGAVVTYTFNECTGPRGFRQLSGQVVVEYGVSVQGVTAHATADDFHAGGTTIDVDATAVYTNGTSGKSLTVETTGQGTGPRGNTFTRTGSYTVGWTDTCFTLNGSWMTTVGALSRSTTVADFEVCEGGCPSGVITHTGFGGRTFVLSFNGSATADWIAGELVGSVSLSCTP
jgi:hypothetical protein